MHLICYIWKISLHLYGLARTCNSMECLHLYGFSYVERICKVWNVYICMASHMWNVYVKYGMNVYICMASHMWNVPECPAFVTLGTCMTQHIYLDGFCVNIQIIKSLYGFLITVIAYDRIFPFWNIGRSDIIIHISKLRLWNFIARNYISCVIQMWSWNIF